MRSQLHKIQTDQRCFTEDTNALAAEVKQQKEDWAAAMELREQAARDQELVRYAAGPETI